MERGLLVQVEVDARGNRIGPLEHANAEGLVMLAGDIAKPRQSTDHCRGPGHALETLGELIHPINRLFLVFGVFPFGAVRRLLLTVEVQASSEQCRW